MSYLYQARSGIARSGATVSDDFSRVYAYVTINGVSRRLATNKDTRPTTITEQKDANGKTAFVALIAAQLVSHYSMAGFPVEAFDANAFQVEAGDAWIPQAGQEIIIGVGSADNRWFGGHILKRSQTYFQKSANLIYELECGGYWWVFGQKLVFGTTPTAAADVMVKSLVATFAPWCLTAAPFVETGLATVQALTFDGTKTLAQVVVEIAQQVGAAVWVDDYRRLHFRVTPESGFDPPTITDFSTLLNDALRFTVDDSQVADTVYCLGPSGTSTNAIAASVASNLFVVTYPVGGEPNVPTSGTLLVGLHLYGYTGATVSPGSITYTLVADAGPSLTHYVAAIAVDDPVTYIAVAADAASIAAHAALLGYTDGVREMMLSSPTPNTAQGTDDAAAAALALYKDGEVSTNYLTRAKKHHAGRTVTFALPGMTFFSQAMTIAGVTFSQFDFPDRMPLRSVTASETYRTYIGHLATVIDRSRKTVLTV